MDFYGLLKKFKINRPLTEWEVRRQLHPHKSETRDPWGQVSVIKMNSTYLECVDKFFKEKGVISALGITALALIIWALLGSTTIIASRETGSTLDTQRAVIRHLIIMSAITLPVIIFFVYMLSKELFRYTHYPIRFNRKNRMVYVTRLDGMVMAESWDKIFFAEGDCGKDGVRDIRGHFLAEDGITVLATFALPVYGHVSASYRFSFWEFVRRYMEEGPEKLMTRVEWTVNVSERRESFAKSFGVHYLDAESGMGAAAFLLFPMILWYAIGRWIANHTSRIPRWPAEVEAECQIEPNDPYLIDRDHPPPPMDKK